MKTPFAPRPSATRNLGSSLSHRARNWLTLGLVAVLSLSASAQAQLNVVNGDFSDLTGLSQGNDGWYTGLPTGWSGSGSVYAVNAKTGTAPPTCNPSQLGFLRQNVGAVAGASEVVLTFDVSEHWAAGAVLNAAILDGNFVQLAGGDFSAGSKQTLVAKQVPAGTSIIIAFQAAKLTPGLDNVSIALKELDSSAPAVAQPPVASGPKITVASYYFGNYHPGDPRNVKNKGPDWSEWELVKAARPWPGQKAGN